MTDNLKYEIKKFANSIGISKIGFTSVDNYTCIAMLFPYFVEIEDGNIAMYARGKDYHKIGEGKMDLISNFLKLKGANYVETHIDKGNRDDRKSAYMAGLAFYGKNNLLICHEYGSYFTIGQILTDLKIEPDKPLEEKCLNCGRCVEACIGSALGKDGFIPKKCASHISQIKGELDTDQLETLSKSRLIWGCDICQTVCPHNKDLKTNAMPELLDERITFLSLEDIPDSNREFMNKFRNYAFSWRGRKTLERNLCLLCKKTKNI